MLDAGWERMVSGVRGEGCWMLDVLRQAQGWGMPFDRLRVGVEEGEVDDFICVICGFILKYWVFWCFWWFWTLFLVFFEFFGVFLGFLGVFLKFKQTQPTEQT